MSVPDDRDRTLASVERSLRDLNVDELLKVAEFVARLRQNKEKPCEDGD